VRKIESFEEYIAKGYIGNVWGTVLIEKSSLIFVSVTKARTRERDFGGEHGAAGGC
jgi:hypothetical protein